MRRRMVAGMVGLGSIVLAGCGQGAPGVSVHQISSNINFGLSSTTTLANRAAAAPISVSPQNLAEAGQVPAFVFTTTTTYNFGSSAYGSSSSSGANAAPCPQPPYGASPDRAVSLSVTSPPQEGTYRWQVVDSQLISGTNTTLKTTHYVNYVIDNVTKTTTTPNPVPGESATTTFDYDEVSPGSDGGTVTTTYEVKENAPQVSGSAGNVGQSQHAGEPDRGVSLAAVVDKNAAGTVTGSFHPSVPVLLFPLDVQTPQSFQSAGIDPTTGASFSNNATANGQTTRVNACGAYVDGWSVTSTQTFSIPSSNQTSDATVDYAVAPQYGGLIISSASTPQGSSSTETDEIGTLSPQPSSGGSSGGSS